MRKCIWRNLLSPGGEEGCGNGPISQMNALQCTKIISLAHFNNEAHAAWILGLQLAYLKWIGWGFFL